MVFDPGCMLVYCWAGNKDLLNILVCYCISCVNCIFLVIVHFFVICHLLFFFIVTCCLCLWQVLESERSISTQGTQSSISPYMHLYKYLSKFLNPEITLLDNNIRGICAFGQSTSRLWCPQDREVGDFWGQWLEDLVIQSQGVPWAFFGDLDGFIITPSKFVCPPPIIHPPLQSKHTDESLPPKNNTQHGDFVPRIRLTPKSSYLWCNVTLCHYTFEDMHVQNLPWLCLVILVF